MTPEEIEDVVRTWGRVRPVRADVVAAVVGGYPPGARAVESRAAWVLEAVERLHLLLGRPARLGEAVAGLVRRRGAVTTDELAEDRDALITGLGAVLGGLSTAEEAAWQHACGLVWEIVSSLAPGPFASGPAGAT